MKTFARFKIEMWYMDLPYVDKLAKGKNGVKYLLVRPHLFNRTVDAKRVKTKDSEVTVCEFLTMIGKTINQPFFGSTRVRNLLQSLKNFGNLTEYKFTLH